MKIKTILILCVALFLSSCEKKKIVEEGVIGQFSIVYMTHNNSDLLYNLTLNIIEFYKDGSVKLPGIVTRNSNIKEDKNNKGTWKVHQKKNKFFVDIVTSNQYFNGTYEISFGVNEEKEGLQMLLLNDKITLGVEKFSFNTTRNQSIVDKLKEYTSYEK